jgi:O-antigen/teichoic acid export membrane protein
VVSIRHGFAWMALAQGSLFILQFVISILIARILGPYEMGIFAIALSIVGLLSIIRSFGLGSYLIRAAELTRSVVATVFTINAGLGVLVSLAIITFSLLGGALLKEPGVRDLLLIMAIMPLLGIFDMIPFALIERRGDFKTVAIVNILRYSVANLSTLAFAYAGYSYMSLGYGQLIGSAVAVVLNNLVVRNSVSVRLGLENWRDVMKFGTQMLTISAIAGLQGRIADMVLAKTLGLAAFGIFSRANSLTAALWENFHVIVLRVLFTDFAEQRRQKRSLRHSYLRLTAVLTGLLWPAFIGIGVISGPLVMTLFGKEWLGAVLPLSILAVSTAIFVLLIIAQDIYVVSNATARQTQLEIIRAPIALALFSAGCLISLEAAASMKVVEAVLVVAMYRRDLERMTDTSWSDYVPIYARGLLLTAAATLPAAMVMTYYHWSPGAPLPAVLAGVAAGGLIWFGTLWALGHPLFEEVQRLVRQIQMRLRPIASPPA